MQAIAAFVLRGRNQAILSIIGFATLALFFTPFGLFSAASVGLVTLVHGAKQGLLITVIASVFMLVISSFTGQTVLGLEYVAFYWLPVWFLAQVLSKNNSLSLAIIVAMIMGMIAAIVLAFLYNTYEAQWNKIILDNLLPAFEKSKVAMSQEEIRQLLIDIGRWVAQFGAAYWVLSMCASLFIARWWQGLLYHPGGFGQEFRALRFGMLVAVAGMAIVTITFVLSGGLLAQIFISLSAIVVIVFMLQGLAIAHHIVAIRKLKIAWLYILYLAMMFLMPYELLLIALIGLSDNWVNYRLRVKPV